MITKGLPAEYRRKLIDLCQNFETTEVAEQIASGFEHLTKEQIKEIRCVGYIKHLQNKYPLKFRYFVRFGEYPTPTPLELFRMQNLPAEEILEKHYSPFFKFTDGLKGWGYQGRKLVTRKDGLYCQFFCGKSKPSLELKIKSK